MEKRLQYLHERLPVELWFSISNDLDPEDVLSLSQVGVFARDPALTPTEHGLILDVPKYTPDAILQVSLGPSSGLNLSQAQALSTVLSCGRNDACRDPMCSSGSTSMEQDGGESPQEKSWPSQRLFHSATTTLSQD
jgi:hypothetical protein